MKMDVKDIFEELEQVKKNIDFIADALQLDLPKEKNYHDCRIHTIQMSGNVEGDIFLSMPNIFHEMRKVQVKYCPVCGLEGNNPPLMNLTMFPRSGDEPR